MGYNNKPNNKRKHQTTNTNTKNDDNEEDTKYKSTLKRGRLSRREERKLERDDKKKRKVHHFQQMFERRNPEKAEDNKRKKDETRKVLQEKMKKKREKRERYEDRKETKIRDSNNAELEERKAQFLKSIGIGDNMTSDDHEIRYLEAKLGINKKKKKRNDDTYVPQSFSDDGLDFLMKPLKSGKEGDNSESEDEDQNLEIDLNEDFSDVENDGQEENDDEVGDLDDEDVDDEEDEEEDEEVDQLENDGQEENGDEEDLGEYDDDADALMDELEDALNGLDEGDQDDEEFDMEGFEEGDFDPVEDDEEDDQEEEPEFDSDDEEIDSDEVDGIPGYQGDDEEIDGDEIGGNQDEEEEDQEIDDEEIDSDEIDGLGDDQDDQEEEEESEEEIKPIKSSKKKVNDEQPKTTEDIYGRVVDSVTGEIIKDNVGVGSEGKGKYVPPHLRQQQQAVSIPTPSSSSSSSSSSTPTPTQQDINLQRKLKGLLNKLATNNFHVIYNDISQLFNEKPRNILKQLITELILQNCGDKEQVIHNIIHANCALVAAIHGGIGTDIGGNFIEELFKKYQNAYRSGTPSEVSNMVLTICHLYNFQVISKLLIVDLAKRYIETFSEIDIQLLQLLIQNAGYHLRGDDPIALKDIILLVQKKHAEYKNKEGDQLSKINFMLDTMTNLKNNKLQNTKLIDTLTQLKKAVRSLLKTTDTSMTSNTMRISLKDLEAVDNTGRWWLVGSSWAGVGGQATKLSETKSSKSTESSSTKSSFTSELLQLAAANRMVTDIQKAIFCIIMSSEDYADAFDKIMKLELKDKQDREVINIVLHCCLKEKKFNPYYFHLINRLTSHNSGYKFTLQYNIWDRLKTLKTLSATSLTMVVNLANMVARLIESNVYSLTLLKVVDFNTLDPLSIVFFRILFTYLLTLESEDATLAIFERIVIIEKESVKTRKTDEHMESIDALRKGVGVFFMHGLLPSTPSSSTKLSTKEKQQLDLLKARAKAAKQMMKSDTQFNLF